MQINILTLFPAYFSSSLESSIIGKAVKNEKIEINIVNIRDFSQGNHRETDDRPYGGGPGMVMMIDPIYRALVSLGEYGQKNNTDSKIILTSAKGSIFTQQTASNYSQLKALTIICGHYEGVDERVAEYLIDEEVRIGDYVLTGGEPAALVISDSVARLIDGVLGNKDSNQNESHSTPGKLGFPQYTRPEEYLEWKVPDILLSGHHKKIQNWRKDHSS